MIPVLIDRYRLQVLRHEVEELRFGLEMRSADSRAGTIKAAL
jgi:hypothetical protein